MKPGTSVPDGRPVGHILLVAGLAVCAGTLVLSGTALAHPWGTPPEAVVGGDGHRVTVQWSAEEDDALILGAQLGVIDPESLTWGQEGPQAPPGSDGLLLPPVDELEAYLLANIRVVQHGAVCPATIEPFEDFVVEGATTVHDCPEPVEVVQLEISMLHDLHEAYRTFAASLGGAQPDQAVFTTTTPRHDWTFGDGAADPAGGGPWVQTFLTAAFALAVAGVAFSRRRRRRRLSGRQRDGSVEEERPGELLGSGTNALVPPFALLAVADRLPLGWLEGEFVRLIDLERVGLLLGAIAVLVAFGIGAAHALAPGHGKGLIAAYLVGTRGRLGDAVALGAVVAGMHCASVLFFGGVLFTTVTLRGDIGKLMPWMSVAAGGLVMAVGLGLVVRQVHARLARRVIVDHRGHAHHDQGHDDRSHAHGHHHSHELPEGVRPLSRRGIMALGAAGGLLPSPSAFLVLATAILTGRALFGFLLVAAFSLGLASTLTVFGLAAVRGRTYVERRAATNPRLSRITAVVPLVSSVLVLLGGLWITTLALLRL